MQTSFFLLITCMLLHVASSFLMKRCSASLIRTRKLLSDGPQQQSKGLDVAPGSFGPFVQIGKNTNEVKAKIEPLEKKIEKVKKKTEKFKSKFHRSSIASTYAHIVIGFVLFLFNRLCR